MKIAITGGKGFVGSNLIKTIDTQKNEIIVLTRGETKSDGLIKYINTDYHDENSVIKATQGAKIIIHLAATLFARNKKEFIKENVISTRNLVKASNINGVKKFIYISSLAAGGTSKDFRRPRTEDTPDNPKSNYGISKLMAEEELKKLKTDWVILRPPIVYGPKDDGFSTIAEWVRKGVMISPSSSDARFSFIFVKDLARCIVKCVEDDSIKNEKYYVCENKIYAWEEFITIMSNMMGVKKPKMIKMPKSMLNLTALTYEIFSYIAKTKPVLNRDKVREACSYHWIASPKKWEEKTGMKNWTSIEEGLRITFSNLV
ncbi:MAG: NAD-dependent epimerase/dehydratase family protein [Elusimicrobiales bacterium]